MKKYLLPSALILCFGLLIANAQTINKALQLSQDSSGAFGIDTNNYVYFPGHILSTGPGTPSITACGSGSPVVVGSDTAGEVTQGTTTTICSVAFNKVYLATPWCVFSWQFGSPSSYAVSTGGFTVSQVALSSNKVNYFCSGSK